MRDSIKIKGYVRLQVKDKEGNVFRDTGFMENVITNGSFAVFSGLAGNTGAQTAFTFLAVGTSATAATASQTTLVAEITASTDTGLTRHAATVTRSTTTQANDTLQLDYTWTAAGAPNASTGVNEIGVFNAISSGVMAARKVLPATLTLSSGLLLVATYKIIFS